MSRMIDFRALLLPRRPTIQSDVLNQLEWHGVDAIRVLLAANPGSAADAVSGERPLGGDTILLGNANAYRSEVQEWLKWKAAVDGWWIRSRHHCRIRRRDLLALGIAQVNPARLLSVAPEGMGEDEQVIAKHYKDWIVWVPPVVPLAAAHFVEVKWVIALGVAAIAPALIAVEQRLYDLCIRVRRTNELLRATDADQREQLKNLGTQLFYLIDAFDAEETSNKKSAVREARINSALGDLAKRAGGERGHD